MLRIGLGEQDGKFLSPIPAYHVKLPQLLVEDGGDLSQDFVSQEMAKFIVQTFELVDIHHNYSHTGAESLSPLNFLGDAQEATIEDSR